MTITEDDKVTLREVELELLDASIPAYRAAAARGQVELSTSPFYHPILPLLCDTDAHLRAHPDSPLPRAPFRAARGCARAVDAGDRAAQAAVRRTPARGVAVGRLGVGRRRCG